MRGKKRCDRIVFVYETPESAVVVFFQHTPERPVALEMDGPLPADYEPSDTFKRFDAGAGSGMIRGRVDERGTAVLLEDDDYWSDVVEAGCRHHLGMVRLSRAELMDAVRKARRDRRPAEILLRRR
jgi:hypothetical protein